jgi:hypothetical protein
MPAPLEYPRWLGRWPAALTILAYVWVELASGDRDSPEFLALLALAYAAVQLVGMSLWGIDKWNERADGFAVYYNLFARISPFERRDGVLYLRIPLSDLPRLAVLPGTVALLCAMIGSTSFDGLSGTGFWIGIAPDIQKFFIDLGMDLEGALEATYTVGLLGMVLFVAGLYWLGVLGTRLFEREHSLGELAGSFIHSFVPIAAAYVIAHYFSLMVFGGQAMIDLSSDPLGDGADLLGGAGTSIDYRVLGVEAISLVQTIALVLGHVAGLTLAHDRATALFPEPDPATAAGKAKAAAASASSVLFVGVVGAVFNQRSARSQLCMLIVMVAFTSLGIYLLAAQE